MNNFISALKDKVAQSMPNNFGADNYDEHRFGKYVPEIDPGPVAEQKISFTKHTKEIIKKIIGYNQPAAFDINSIELVAKYGDGLDEVYRLVGPESKKVLVDIIAYRILGYKKVKLDLNDSKYEKYLQQVKPLMNNDDVIDPRFMHLILKRANLNPIGYNIDFYFTEIGIVTDFLVEQYAYKLNGQNIIQAMEGDVALDIGGCWGDTALYFAHKVGSVGKVYSFEFIPNNLKIHKRNTGLNPELEKRITVVEHPVSEISGKTIYYHDEGPGSYISDNPFQNQTGSTTTLSIDDFVTINNISKLDFIKMDIEGSEPLALKGAINTLKRFKPKLAVAIYHSIDDIVNIPQWINDLNLGYEFYIGHYKIHQEETILFAKADD